MVRRELNEREREVLKRASNIIRRKLILVGRRARPTSSVDIPVTLIELKNYESGRKQVPLTHLAALLKFYGCSEGKISRWNILLGAAIYHALRAAREG